MRSSALVTALCIAACGCLQLAVADPPAPLEPATPNPPAAGQDAAQLATPASGAAPVGVLPPSDPKTAPPTAAAPAASASNAVTDAQIKKYRSKGYKPLVHDGTTVFCRSEATLGSRLEHQVCRTAEQLDQAAQEAQDMTRDVQRGGTLSTRAPGK